MDKIIITSNDKCGEIIRWYQHFEKYLSANFTPALKEGAIELVEENIMFVFKSTDDDNVSFKINMKKDDSDYVNVCDFNYSLLTQEISGLNIKSDNPMLKMVLAMDNTCGKEILKYRAIMSYMMHHVDLVETKHRKSSKHSSKKNKSQSVNPLGRKVYIINETTEVPKEKRLYTKCDYEFERRGTLRHLKNGKVVPVRGTICNKGKGKRKDKVYKA